MTTPAFTPVLLAQAATPLSTSPLSAGSTAAVAMAPVGASVANAPAPVAALPNGFDLLQLWAQGDLMSKSILFVLLLMSIATWSVMLYKAHAIWRHKRQAKQVEQFWHSRDWQEALQNLQGAHAKGSQTPAYNPFHTLALTAIEAVEHHRATQAQLHDRLDVSDWLTRCLRNTMDDNTSRLQASLAVLASVGATAPFVGLLGTVWGIYQALMHLGQSAAGAGSSIDLVAGPIGETLIMTAMGLAVAIPAVLGYNALVRGNKYIVTRMHRFAHDLHAYFVTGSRVQTLTRPTPEVA